MTDLKNIKAITFDVGGTLIEPWPSVGHIYAEIAAQHGHGKFSPEDLNRRFVQAWKARENFGYTLKDWAAVVDETFAGLASRQPSETFFRELYAHFTRTSAWRIYEDVEPALRALSASGIRLGIISNWDDRLRPLLNDLGLARYFEVIIISCESGCTKPDRAIFDQAIRALALPPNQVMHVGDGLREDLRGATAAGLQAVHLTRGVNNLDGHQINSLSALHLR